MLRSLLIHPDSHRPGAATVRAGAARPSPARLALRFEIPAGADALAIPPTVDAPARRDELWRATCFEAFVRPAGGDGYVEFNLAPSGDWAAYAFDAPRQGMRHAEVAAPSLETSRDGGVFRLSATVELPELAEAAWRVGLTAVLANADGDISLWALAHEPGRADFHRLDSFILKLPAASMS